jgi:exodeoxyribonuclease VII small subunit
VADQTKKPAKQPSPDPAPTSKSVGVEAETLTFERAVERLEAIIGRIESGEIGLEQSIREYEHGVALLKRCRAILEQAEQRVEELTTPKTGDEEAPF